MEKPSLEENNFSQKTLFAPTLNLSMVVSGRVWKRYCISKLFQKAALKILKLKETTLKDTFKKNSFTVKFRGRLRQVQLVKLVKKIDKDRKGVVIDSHTKLQQFSK